MRLAYNKIIKIMIVYEWNESLSVNIESIDKQHKMLLDMINEFYDEIHKIHEGKSTSTLNEVRAELIMKMKDYSIFHFKTEEELFELHNYSDKEAHKKEHDEFSLKVSDIEKKYKEGKLVLSTELTDYLKDWLFEHVKDCDQKYSEFLIEKGVI